MVITGVAPWRVTVGLEPFVVRSAVHTVLLADERFESLLCPPDEDPIAYGVRHGAAAVLVPGPVAASEVLTLEVSSGDTLASLSDGLAERLTQRHMGLVRNFDDNNEEKR
jgi:hypothetical protein